MNFIDFCAGIGGGKLGLEHMGYHSVGFSEIDKNAIEAYRIIHNDDSINFDDLTKIESDVLPDFDLLIGGFPCQTFSIIGERCGLDDCDRGEIIYYISNILEEKKVKYFILENVKGLVNHDKGRTLKIMLDLLQNAGYEVYYKVLNSIDFGVPQLRERIYFVGVRADLTNDYGFEFPKPLTKKADIMDFLIDEDDRHILDVNSITFNTFKKYLNNKYNIGKFTLDDLLKQEYLVLDTRQSDLRLYRDKVPTIRKGRQGILYIKNGQLRKLSGFEAMLLQGFPIQLAQKAKENINNSKLLALSGNAMTVNVITQIAQQLEIYIKGKKINLIDKGSQTAKDGFKNEHFVVEEFNNWQNSLLAKDWLAKMNYKLDEIEYVKALKITGSFKSDVQVQVKIEIKLKSLLDVQNLSVKLVSNPKGFNQIDKRWLENYQELWNIPNDVLILLKHFTGELAPMIPNPLDKRRMFLNEFKIEEQEKILNFFRENKILIVNDILKGRGEFAAEWMLVILKVGGKLEWALEPMNYVLNFFGAGEVKMTPRGSIALGKITIQRKGGDGGRKSANMLQFKINPAELISQK